MTAGAARPKGNRGARVAASASQFSMHACYSNRAKTHGAPASCVDKIKYDCFDSAAKERSRITMTFTSASAKHMHLAADPIGFARLCERTAGRQANCRQMRHFMVALPSRELSARGREWLAIAIGDLVRRMADDQPVWGAIHRPTAGESNYHVHLSHGLREIHLTSSTEYRLGARILSEQRPNVRRALGLSATTHADLRKLREGVAELIAESLLQEDADLNLVERWRFGHFPLEDQVRRAKDRHDWEFVRDHAYRDPTAHEGYSGGTQRKRLGNELTDTAQSHVLTPHPPIGMRALTKEIVRHVLKMAKRHRLRKFSLLRLLALEHDIIINVIRRKRKCGSRGAVVGLAFQVLGGVQFSGRQINISLTDLCTTHGIDRSSVTDIEVDWNFEHEYLREAPAQPDEIRTLCEGRVTEAFVLFILAQKAQTGDSRELVSEAAQTRLPSTGEPTVDAPDFAKIVAELRLPLTEGERRNRDALILSELAPDDYLRAYVQHQQSLASQTKPHGILALDLQGETFQSADESDPESAISELLSSYTQGRQRQSTSI